MTEKLVTVTVDMNPYNGSSRAQLCRDDVIHSIRKPTAALDLAKLAKARADAAAVAAKCGW